MKAKNYMWVAVIEDTDNPYPIAAADSFDNLKRVIDSYFGSGEDPELVGKNKCLGYTSRYSKYGGDYDGYYEYEEDGEKYHVDVYCVDSYIGE